jgi:hypothetical protein
MKIKFERNVGIKFEHSPQEIADLAKVATDLAKGTPPDWLLPALTHHARFISPIQVKPDEEVEKQMLRAAELLEHWLPMYGYLEDFDPEFECPECVNTVSNELPELIELLKRHSEVPKRAGGPNPDGRRLICAAVVGEAYRMVHDRLAVEPYSAVREACEDYWKACGNGATGKKDEGEPRNWERLLLKVKDSPDDWVRTALDRFRRTPP